MLELFPGGFAADPSFKVVPSQGPSYAQLTAAPIMVGAPDWYEQANASIASGADTRLILSTDGPRPPGTLATSRMPETTPSTTNNTLQTVAGVLNSAISTAGQVYQAKAAADSSRREGKVKQPKMPSIDKGSAMASLPSPIVNAAQRGMSYLGDTKAEQHQNLMRIAMIATIAIVGGVIIIRMTHGGGGQVAYVH